VTRSIFTTAYQTLLEALVAARISAGVTQAELARRLKKPQSFVSKVEIGARRLDVIEFYAVAIAIDHEPAELFAAIAQKLPVSVEI